MPATITGSQNGTVGLINAATAQNSTSGTAIDFTGIPAGVRRITVMFNGVSTNGASPVQVQLGTSGGLQTSGYNGTIQYSGAAVANLTTGFKTEDAASANYVRNGLITVCLLGSNVWAGAINSGLSNQASAFFGGGTVTLSGTLDRVRITTVNGTDTFDAGSINILYE